MSASLSVDRDGDCWVFTLNRPEKRNALDAELVEALISAVEQAHATNPSLLVFRASGKNFCAGFDFSGFQELSEADLLWRFVRIEQLLQMLHSSPVLTVALAHGHNFGAGVDLIASCKHRISDSQATFRMPGLKFGLVLGTRRFASLVGAERARQILQATKTLNATQALEVGLLSEVVEPDLWEAALNRQKEVLDQLTPQARRSLYQVLRHDSDDSDLADLVRSVVNPGLKERIAKYRTSD